MSSPYSRTALALLVGTLLASTAQAEPNLVAHWQFDNEAIIGQATLSTDLVAVGDAAYSAAGKIGGALLLDGSGDYLRVDSDSSLPSGLPTGDASYSIAAFIKTTNNGRNTIARWGNGSGGGINGFRTTSAGEFASSGGLLNYGNGGGTDFGQGAGGPPPGTIYDGTWHHAAVTYDSTTSTKRLYLDGLEIGTGQVIGNDLKVQAVKFTLGSAGSEEFKGLIDDLRVYDDALSDAEIKKLANTITVTTIADEDNGSLDPNAGTGISLREAILYASSGGTVNFAPAIDGGIITLGATELLIDKSLSISASALPAGLTIKGSGSSRVFQIGPNGVVEMHSLSINDGNANAAFPGNNGGGIFNAGISLTLINCTFLNNHATSYGGALYNANGSPTLTNCSFTDNSAAYGGAILNEGSAPTLTDCSFQVNQASVNGGAVHNFQTSAPLFTNCEFSGNTAASSGGAVINYVSSSPTFVNCSFSENSAALGGAMENNLNSSPVIQNCEFLGNTASNLGGALLSQKTCSPTVASCTFQGNQSTTDGGALSTFSTSTLTVTNSIVWDNTANGATNTASASAFNDGTSSTTYSHSLLGGYSKTDLNAGNADANNLDSLDPLFLNAATGDLHPTANSPVIDAGLNAAITLSQDLAGSKRIQNGTVDLGAYEAYIVFAFTEANAVLETAILNAVNKQSGPVTLEDMELLTNLRARNGSIYDLSALRYATNLSSLNLSNNQIVDLSPLAGLTELGNLDLSSNQIVDLSPLAGLTKLNNLDLGSNQIVDISPLVALTELYDLDLSSNRIIDLSPLAGLTELGELILSSNQIIELSPLAALTELGDLTLSSNQLVHLNPLAALTELYDLDLSFNKITDISPLAALTNLDDVQLRGNQFTDLSPLSGLENMEDLDVSINPSLTPLLFAGSPQQAIVDALIAKSVSVTFDALVSIPDPALEAAIRQEVSISSDFISTRDMANLKSLYAATIAIRDLTGLEYAVNLDTLYIENNQIVDLSPLAGLTALDFIHLDNNQIVDLSPLSGLPALSYLELAGNQIVDLSPLASLSTLNSLSIDSNQIADLTPLAGLTKLEYLSATSNQISDLSPLASLSTLNGLSIDTNQIADITPLAGLTKLEYLSATSNQITDLTPLATLTSLTSISLNSNLISDLSPLTSLPSLGYLYLSDNQIANFSPLSELPALSTLDLSSSQIADLSPFSGLTTLYQFNLNDNQIVDLSPLSPLTGLGILELDSNQIVDLAPLSTLTELAVLQLDDNQITDISPLSALTKLVALNLNRNQFANISPLAPLTELRFLELDSNQIADLSPLSALIVLENLALDSNQIANLSPLSQLPKLRDLSADSNLISDLTPLSTLARLRLLSFNDNQIVNLSPLSALDLNTLQLDSNQIVDLSPITALPRFTLSLKNNQIIDLTPLAELEVRSTLFKLTLTENPHLLLYPGSPQQAIVDALIAKSATVIYDAGIGPPQLSAYLSKIAQPATTISIDVTTTGNWTVTENADWLSADKEQELGNATVVLTATANPNATLRTANVLFNDEIHVVRQRGLLPSADPDFPSWLASYFTAEEIAAMLPNSAQADSDRDQLNNRAEWKLGLDPSDFASRLITTLTIGATTLTLQVTPIPQGIAPRFQSSTNLIDWLPVPATPTRNATTLSVELDNPTNALFLQILPPEDPDTM